MTYLTLVFNYILIMQRVLPQHNFQVNYEPFNDVLQISISDFKKHKCYTYTIRMRDLYSYSNVENYIAKLMNIIKEDIKND